MLKYTIKRVLSVLTERIKASDRDPVESFQDDIDNQTPDHPPGPSAFDQRQESLRILELPTNATTSEIKQTYLRLCKKYHPDRFANDPKKLQLANDLFSKIRAAYGHLKT